jgi:hypothetical protein
MTITSTNFNNLLNINIKNKKNVFTIKNNTINKVSQTKLVKMKKLNIISYKKGSNSTMLRLKFFENRFAFKNLHK